MSALAGKQELHAEVGKLVETQLARIAEIAKALKAIKRMARRRAVCVKSASTVL